MVQFSGMCITRLPDFLYEFLPWPEFNARYPSSICCIQNKGIGCHFPLPAPVSGQDLPENTEREEQIKDNAPQEQKEEDPYPEPACTYTLQVRISRVHLRIHIIPEEGTTAFRADLMKNRIFMTALRAGKRFFLAHGSASAGDGAVAFLRVASQVCAARARKQIPRNGRPIR